MTGGQDQGGLMSEINVTPFVDVMLVLLIIFMVTAPMMVQGVNVTLPETSGDQLESEKDHLTITIRKDLRVFINDRHIALPALKDKLSVIHSNRPDDYAFLKADKAVPYGLVMRVMADAKEAGFTKLGAVTEPIKETGKDSS